MLSLLMALAAASAPVESDPYAAPPEGEVAAMVRSAQFGEPGADSTIVAWLKANPSAPRSDRGRLAHRLCHDLLARNADAPAAEAWGAAGESGADDARAAAISAALREDPRIQASGAARVGLTPNGVGSRDASVTVDGVSAPWLVDTGAEISVVSSSLARRIGLHPRPGPVTVQSTTGVATGEMAIIDRLDIGDAAVENVPVLVLPDAQLKIGDRPQIQAILGLPVLVAFGRAAWLDAGATLALGEAAPTPPPDAPSLYWNEEGIGLPVSTDRGVRGGDLDTGANETSLRAPIHALLSPKIEASAVYRRGKVGGAGGVVDTNDKVYPEISLNVAGVPMALKNVSLNEAERDGVARLGADVVARLSLLDMDFETMRVAVRPLTGVETPAR
jgi:clan AA aspartic protease (TIGR02281 family)